MEAILSYVVKSGSILLVFTLLYYLLLRKETFFKTNRFFLLSGLLVSVLLPLITFTKTIWIDPIPVTEINKIPHPVMLNASAVPAENIPAINWFMVIGFAYLLGVAFFIAQFVFDYYALRKVLIGKTIRNVDNYKIIETSDNLTPFSWFSYIVYNPASYNASELENILEHEKTHCRQWHSADVIFSRLFCIAFWFNPIAWLHKSMMIQNLEFIADSEASRKIASRKNYQITLLKVTAHENCLAFTNHFYQSLIKKRIVMLNKKASKKRSLWKYGIVIPLLTAFMLQFQVNVIAQEKTPLPYTKSSFTTISVNIEPGDTDEKLKEIKEFAETYKITLEFSGIKRDEKGNLIYIIAVAKGSNGKTQKYATAGTDGDTIGAFQFFVKNPDEKNMEFGFQSMDQPHPKGKTVTTREIVVTSPDEEVTSSKTVKKDESYAVELNSANTDSDKPGEEGYSMGYFKTSKSEDVISEISENETIDAKKALIKINGKESTYEEMMKINPKKVASKSTIFASSKSIEGMAKIIEVYGDKAQFGIIEIELKGYKPEPNADERKSAESFTLDYNEGGFIIHKKSGKSDFKFYKKELAKIDLKLEISKIEHNDKGEITGIRVNLTDTKNGTGGMTFWNTTENKQGIPDIEIGRRSGKVLVSSKK